MLIQYNTDNNIKGSQEKSEQFEQIINEQLKRFSEQISRIEVYINDENSHKAGQDDIRCTLEARLDGQSPVAVTHYAGDQSLALKGALTKLKSMLETITGKMRNY